MSPRDANRSALATVFVGSYDHNDPAQATGLLTIGTTVPQALDRAVALASGAPQRPPGPLSRAVDMGDDAVHRLTLAAWVLVNRRTHRVELWIPALCPHHDPPSPATTHCPGPEHPRSHPVEGCQCWCSGLTATVFAHAVTLPPAASLGDAARVLMAFPEPGRTPLASLVEALQRVAVVLTEPGAVGVWATLVAEGTDPYEALSSAARITRPR